MSKLLPLLIVILGAALSACTSSSGSSPGPEAGVLVDAAPGNTADSALDAGCVPACVARTCGDDSCGGICGTCDLALTCSSTGQCVERTELDWAGIHWYVRQGGGGPGPNTWDRRNVWVDGEDVLHLKIANRNGVWSSAEVTAAASFGFGRFQWWVEGPLDRLDRNIVLGLFTYPTREVGPDGTNEIDIEIARWGEAVRPPLNYTIFPATVGTEVTSHAAPMTLSGTYTTHRFAWLSDRIDFTSLHGFRDDDLSPITTWTFAPPSPADQVPQTPVPVHMNLWLYRGQPPSDGAEIEIAIHAFAYAPP